MADFRAFTIRLSNLDRQSESHKKQKRRFTKTVAAKIRIVRFRSNSKKSQFPEILTADQRHADGMNISRIQFGSVQSKFYSIA